MFELHQPHPPCGVLETIPKIQNPGNPRRLLREGILKQAELEYVLDSSDVANFVESLETLSGYRAKHSLVAMNLVLLQQQRKKKAFRSLGTLLFSNLNMLTW